MTQGRVYTGDDVEQDLELACDVCVVGSGSGGAFLAHSLVERGLSVVMLEEGGHHTRGEFDLTEATANVNLYQDLGARGTDDRAVNILQGRCVGGGTTVNWCSCFRTPKSILELWRTRHGVKGLTEEALVPHWEAAEKRLSIAEWPLERVNPNNRVLWDGLGRLGWHRGLIRRNVRGCVDLGYCGMGCPIDAKQSMLVSIIPDAVERGLTLYSNARAVRVETAGRRVAAVHAEVLDPRTDRPSGRRLTVKPKVAAVCGGAINSPALLLRSGLDGDGRVGKRTFFHPVVVTVALFEEKISPFSGAPQSVYSHQFYDRGPDRLGFYIEVPPIHPVSAAAVSAGFGPKHQEFMSQLAHLQGCFAGAIDGVLEGDEGGEVGLRGGGRLSVRYPLTARHWEALKEACKVMAKIQFAAGARKVLSLHADPVELTSVDQVDRLLDAAPWEPLRVRVTSGHLMGGCAMGEDPSRSVVDSRLRYHALDNLFVVDGSVFPTSLGVNPQQTIFGLARWAAPHLADVAR